MIATDSNKTLLQMMLEQYQIETTDEQRELLLRHLDLVVEKNKVMNLTRIVEDREAIVRHVVDSLLLLDAIERYKSSAVVRFLDIGTGAGFPGIPLGIMTEHQGLLIDSVGKKVKSVEEFIDALGLGDRLSARATRAEELAVAQPKSFDVVVARAVADLGVLVEYASPLLRRHGVLVVSKANISEEEMGRGDETGEIVGLERVSRETCELPDEQGHREIITYQKVRTSKVKLPRPVGMAKKKPLA
jgi:16S rRNA (guanine527-N7)-methyltransferase